jgi:mRNA degradation ribonuclease J1/J2
MKIRIHRGAHEIGGNCIEVVADAGTRIVLDAGSPLDDGARASVGVPAFDGRVDAVLVSHPHLDPQADQQLSLGHLRFWVAVDSRGGASRAASVRFRRLPAVRGAILAVEGGGS